MDSIKVLVVEDNDAFRQFIRNTVQDEIGSLTITEAADGLSAVDLALEIKPDLIVLDLGLPGLNGLEVAKIILTALAASRILFLSSDSSKEVVQEALMIGATGYVVKSDAGRELTAALRAVLRGDCFLSSRCRGLDFGLGLRMLI
jgi:DNA-binding NarL/FixJ family response regulator